MPSQKKCETCKNWNKPVSVYDEELGQKVWTRGNCGLTREVKKYFNSCKKHEWKEGYPKS